MSQSAPIKSTDIIENGLFDPSKKSGEELLKTLKDLIEGLKLINKESVEFLKVNRDPKTAAGLKEVIEHIDKARKSRQALANVEKEASKAQEKFDQEAQKRAAKEAKKAKVRTDAEIQADAVFKAINKRRIAELEALAIATSDLIGTEERLVAQNKALAIERSRLREEDANYRTEIERINNLINENNKKIAENSDKLKQNRLNVGNYTDSVREAINSSEIFTKGLAGQSRQSQILIGGFRAIGAQLTQIKAKYREAEGAGKKFKVAAAGAGGVAAGVLAAAFGSAVATSREFEVSTKVFLSQLSNTVGAFASALGNLFANKLIPQLDILILRAKKFFSGDFSDDSPLANQIDVLTKKTEKYQNLFVGIFDRIKEGNKTVEELVRLQDDLVDTSAVYAKQISSLNALAEIQNEIAGDNTRSFKELQEANEKALKFTRAKAALEVDLAKKQQDAAAKEVRVILENLGLSKQVTDQEIKNLSFITKAGIEKKVSTEAVKKISEATVAVQEKQNALALSELKINRELRQVKQDQLERDLDILIDGFDNQKTVNEKLIADDKRVFDNRRMILAETRKLSDDSFKKQEETFQQFTEKRIDLQSLADTQDAKVLNDRIRALGLSEIIEGRVLEAVRERRLAVSDLAEAERQLNQQEKEKNARIKESKDNIEQLRIETQIAQNQRREGLEARKQEAADYMRNRRRIELLNEETAILQEQAELERLRETDIAQKTIVEEDEKLQKMLEINKKYLADLNRIEQDKADKTAELRRQEFNSAVNYANKTTQDVLSNFDTELDKKRQIQSEYAQKDLERTKTNIDRQRALAERGLANELAFQEQQAAKKELAQRDAAQRAQREKEVIQLTEAYFNALNARLTQFGADPNTAPARALGDILLAKGIAKGIVQFAAEGNDDVQGPGTTKSDSIPFMLSKHEGVVKAEANMGNKGVVASLNDGSFRDKFIPISQFEEAASSMRKSSYDKQASEALIKRQVSLLEKIAAKPVAQVSLDGLGNIVERTIKDGHVKKVVTKTRLSK